MTTLNYGADVPMKVTEITLAHEIGHNFGSKVFFFNPFTPGRAIWAMTNTVEDNFSGGELHNIVNVLISVFIIVYAFA